MRHIVHEMDLRVLDAMCRIDFASFGSRVLPYDIAGVAIQDELAHSAPLPMFLSKSVLARSSV